MDQHGCGENDPNGPVFDPVHGVFHHFYQIHLAAPPGFGADYGHFVSKDFIHWAAMPVAIWNGLDASVWPPRATSYDSNAIFTGSALVLEGAGPKGSRGIVQIYPGLCNARDWPGCETGTLLAQAVPADYASDVLLTNWTKPSYNPIMENTQRDPSTPWQTPTGEWRLRTYDSRIYGAANASEILHGRWYEIGKSESLRTCECPSFYPLPPPTAGRESETAYAAAMATGGSALPTHVHKTSCGGDFWQLGTYDAGPRHTTGTFSPTAGWEDTFAQRRIDHGRFYASKDSIYPTLGSSKLRRINWGWAQVPPQGAQTLPREITFNAAARQLEQAPIAELAGLRLPAAFGPSSSPIAVPSGRPFVLPVRSADLVHSELVLKFERPMAGSFGEDGVVLGIVAGPLATSVGRGATVGALREVIGDAPTVEPTAEATPDLAPDSTMQCTVHYTSPANVSAPFHEVPVSCGGTHDKVRLLQSESTISLRVFFDATMLEAYFQNGRVAITEAISLSRGTPGSQVAVTARARLGFKATLMSAALYPMKSIWTTPDVVRQAPRIYDV